MGTSVKINFTSPVTVTGTYQVKLRKGSDGNTVSDFCDNMINQGTGLSFTVQHIAPVASIAAETDQTCTMPGSAMAALTGGTPPFNYLWNTSPPQTGLTAHNLSEGNYHFEATDANGCIANATAQIQLAGMPELTFTKFSVRCDSAFSGEATVHVNGGTAPFQYSWNTQPPQTTQTATGLSVGSYIATVTTADGCVITDTVSIPVIGLPDLIVSHTNISCDGLTQGSASVAATGNSPFTYEWSTVPPQLASQISNLAAGTYSVTVTDSLGCMNNASVHIGHGGMSLATTTVNLHCATLHNGSATVAAANGTAPYHYEWNTDPVQQGATATQLAGGNYSVTVSDAGGCVETTSVIVTAPPEIIVTVSTTEAGCGISNGSASLNVAGGYSPYTFSWTTLPGQFDSVITGVAAGIYPVEITDTAGCIAHVHAYVANPDGPDGFITDVTDATCDFSNGSATVTRVTGNGPFTYTWDTSPLQHSVTATGLAENIYYVMITDVNGCVSFLHVKINRTPKALLALASTTNASCSHADGTAGVWAQGGLQPYQFEWNTSPPQFDVIAGSLAAGNYSVFLTDGNSCKDTLEVIISEDKAVNDFHFTPACLDEPVLFSASTDFTGSATWTWDFGDGAQQSHYNILTGSHIFKDTATYPVTLFVNGGCATDTLQKMVKGAYKPAASFAVPGEKYFASAQVQFYYTGSAVNLYSWDFGDGEKSALQSPKHVFSNPSDSAVIQLIVTDQQGCTDTATSRIFVEGPPAVWLPNSFTPNGDGLNDYFNVPSAGLRKGALRIFDRWGKEIFHSENLALLTSVGWDGSVNGQPAPEGSYTYLLDATMENESSTQYKGVITLIH